jgi:NADPH:quinone reductase-like Zn-dependent oxidoreductase
MASKRQRQSIGIRRIEGRPGEVYYPLEKRTYIEGEPGDDELIVKLSAVSLNHRDLFIRQHLYPGTTFDVPLLSDGCGTVIATGTSPSATALLHKRVIINPGSGWQEAPEGPEDPTGYKILGGTKLNPKGTLAETIRVSWTDVEEAPSHLSNTEAAAIPLTGLTAWRALTTKSGNAMPGRNILITGIGGGVALTVLAYGVAMGLNAYVTSSNAEKLDKAQRLGASGGVRYDEKGWEQQLLAQLPEDRRYFDAIIDGAGGSIVQSGVKLLKVSTSTIKHRQEQIALGQSTNAFSSKEE